MPPEPVLSRDEQVADGFLLVFLEFRAPDKPRPDKSRTRFCDNDGLCVRILFDLPPKSLFFAA